MLGDKSLLAELRYMLAVMVEADGNDVGGEPDVPLDRKTGFCPVSKRGKHECYHRQTLSIVLLQRARPILSQSLDGLILIAPTRYGTAECHAGKI
jgi:hypothetical protein